MCLLMCNQSVIVFILSQNFFKNILISTLFQKEQIAGVNETSDSLVQYICNNNFCFLFELLELCLQ